MIGLDLSGRWRCWSRRGESWCETAVEPLKRRLIESPWLWRSYNGISSDFMPRGGSSKNRVKLCESVSCLGEGLKMSRGTLWPDRWELVKFMLLMGKRWPGLSKQRARIMLGLKI